MARCFIVAKTEEGVYRGIYCHSFEPEDEFTLRRNYSTPEMVKRLIDLGNLSQIGTSLGHRQDFNNPEPDTCVAYGRDRNDPIEEVVAKIFPDLEAAHLYANSRGCALVALYENGFWRLAEVGKLPTETHTEFWKLVEDHKISTFAMADFVETLAVSILGDWYTNGTTPEYALKALKKLVGEEGQTDDKTK